MTSWQCLIRIWDKGLGVAQAELRAEPCRKWLMLWPSGWVGGPLFPPTHLSLARPKSGAVPAPRPPGPCPRASAVPGLGVKLFSVQLEVAQAWECCTPRPTNLRGIVAKRFCVCVSLHQLML